MTGALHDRLRPREPNARAKSLSHCEVCAANKQEPKIGLTQLIVELSIPTSCDIDFKRIICLRSHLIVEGVAASK